jgi:lysozyme
MSDEQRLFEQLKRHEGFRAHPYRCSAGRLTIGYGRNLDDVGVSEEEAETLLREDMAAASSVAARYLGEVFDEMDEREPVRLAVVENMAFNLGGRLMGFRNFRAALGAGDWNRAADEMLDSRWARQVGARAVELAEQMRTGAWRD